MKTGYRAAFAEGCEIAVKVDGDGQMDPRLIPDLLRPIIEGQADYTKGNRFYALENLRRMPWARLLGNSALSFVNKVVSGYWDVMDPTNGFTALHAKAFSLLPLEKIENRYFFESDMLFRLNTIRAVVRQVPMAAVYGDENSSLQILAILREFPGKYLQRFLKRILYTFFLRDFNVASMQILAGTLACIWGFSFGGVHWWKSVQTGIPATSGTVILAALPVILGFQMLLAAVLYDTTNVPKEPLQKLLA